MKLLNLEKKSFQDLKVQKCYNRLVKLNEILLQKTLSTETIHELNNEFQIVIVNADKTPKEFKKILRAKTYAIFKIVEKKEKLVPKNYYRNQWLALGMSIFGIPLGMMFGFALGNIALFGIGLPFGMMIGIAIGTNKDSEAAKNKLQLDIDAY